MTIAILALVAIHLAFELMMFVTSNQWTKKDDKIRRDATMCVSAAEQFRGDGKGEEKARIATQTLIDLHPKLKPSIARMLIESAVAEMNLKPKE